MTIGDPSKRHYGWEWGNEEENADFLLKIVSFKNFKQ